MTTSKQVQSNGTSSNTGGVTSTNNEAVYAVAGVMRCEPGVRIAEHDLDLQPVELGVTVRGDAHLACLERARRTLIRCGWQVEF